MNNRHIPTRPLVSVIVPCYNQGEFVAEALDSVAAQRYSNWECIVVDDGSTDRTKEICLKYVDADNRFKYFYQINKGLPAARNFGIRFSKGEFIAFLDSDDFISPDKLERQIDLIDRNPEIDVVYGDYICFENEDRHNTWTYSRVELKQDTFRDFIQNWEKGLSIPIHCFLFKRDCLERNGGFDETFYNSKEDWDLHLKLSISSAIFYYLKGTVAFYRVCTTRERVRNEKLMRNDKFRIYKKYYFDPKTGYKIKWIILKRYIEDLSSPLYKILNRFFYKLVNIFKKNNLFRKNILPSADKKPLS